MKASEIIAVVDALKENYVGDDIKLEGINFVEGRVFCEIHRGKAEDFNKVTSFTEQLSIPAPYSNVYVLYVLAMVAFSNGEDALYRSLMSDFDKAYSEYAKYCMRSLKNS